jgi:alpha-1,2-rhamnosyltransferase
MRKILIDCSFISTTKLNTGIQRVVRKIIENIDMVCNKEIYIPYQVVLKQGLIEEISLTDKNKKLLSDIKPKSGDILLLLDSTWHIDTWDSVQMAKQSGAKIIAVIYDIIPISHPQFCDINLVKVFQKWFAKAINLVDGFITISNTVQTQLENYLLTTFPTKIGDRKFDYFLLGADFTYKNFDIYATHIRDNLISLYKKNKSIYIMVSTVEPRKNHKYLLDVFDKLWEQNIDVTLSIIGRKGWMIEELIKRIYKHPQYNKKLFYWNNLTDNELNYSYKHSKMLLFASFIEGFGLPIIESLNNNLPVMASDIPIHREVGSKYIEYFNLNNIDDLVSKIKKIEKDGISRNIELIKEFKWISWKEATQMLYNKISKMNSELIINDFKDIQFDIIEYISEIIIQKGLEDTLTDNEYIEIAKIIKNKI